MTPMKVPAYTVQAYSRQEGRRVAARQREPSVCPLQPGRRRRSADAG